MTTIWSDKAVEAALEAYEGQTWKEAFALAAHDGRRSAMRAALDAAAAEDARRPDDIDVTGEMISNATLIETLEDICERFDNALDRLGCCGEGDVGDRRGDVDDWGGRNALRKAKDILVNIKAMENPHLRCAATISTDPPQDCGWPFCGCDPKADKVLECLEESGALMPTQADELRNEIANLRAEVERLTKERDDAMGGYTHMRLRAEEAEKEADTLRDIVNDVEARAQSAEAALAERNAEFDQLTGVFEDRCKELDDVRAKQDVLGEDYEMLSQKHKSMFASFNSMSRRAHDSEDALAELMEAARPFTFAASSDKFQSTDGGCTEAIVCDAHVQALRALIEKEDSNER